MPWREAYPELEDDMDRRIEHSEGRIKYWVVAGILANVLTLLGVGAPLVYYFGAMQAQSANTLNSVLETNQKLTAMETRLQREEIHTQMIDAWAQDKGFKPPVRVMTQ